MSITTGLILAAGACFLGYLLYTRQFKWLGGVVRNGTLGAVGMLVLNTLLSPLGLAVGVNALTVFIVGILGLPGLMLLYVIRYIV
jgi:inhibitor of the pro-sigma K processing machinery